MSNPNAPHLPADTLWFERAVLIGDCLSDICFGVLLVVFLLTTYALIWDPPRRDEKRNWTLISYTCVIFTVGIVFIGMNMHELQLMFIDNREFPGGPIAYELSHYSDADFVIANSCAIIAGWLADGFLLYRCLVIFHLKFYIVALPILIYLGSISMGVMFLFQSSRPGASLWDGLSVNFGIPYFSLSASLNVIITILITIRLLLYRRDLSRALGPGQASSVPYASIAAMVTESSMLYAVFSLLFVIPYGANSHISNIFLPILSQIQIIAPMLIILRVARRRAWDARTASAAPLVSTIEFRSGAARQVDSTGIDGNKELGGRHLQPEGSSASTVTQSDMGWRAAKSQC